MDKKRRSSASTTIQCAHCQRSFTLSASSLTDAVRFCLHCGYPFRKKEETEADQKTFFEETETAAILAGMAPTQEKIAFSLGPYQILQKIGQGGMGEVFLAYDTTCGRRLALKKIRADLSEYPHLYRRFLKEARITSQLMHPSVIPIYSIHQEKNTLYYTMPYVEGETLKQILRTTRKKEQSGQPPHPIGSSIPALLRIFVNICHAVSFAHSHGVLHRDLKPENVMIGTFGEVLILDWGLAKIFEEEEEDQANGKQREAISSDIYGDEFTAKGKVVGTISYMSPERALGYPATMQTDIYALGVILYQILALKLPFRRENLKEFKKNMHRETLIDPAQVAPYRDVPPLLTAIVKKCLHANMEERYQKVDHLLRDIEVYLEGGAEWFQVGQLHPKRKQDWEFQENVLIAENFAVTRSIEEADWFNLMISKASFTGNTKLETQVRLEEGSKGVGFLLSIPEAKQRTQINDGFCLWIASETHRATRLLCSTVEVIYDPDIFLKIGEWVHVRIEKIDQGIFVYLNDQLQFSYVSLMPMMGTHIGLFTRDAQYALSDLLIFVGNISATVNCLAIPDAFLAHKDYNTAFSEYKRIGYSFSGRMEGRQAIFRAGYTLVDQALGQKKPQEYYERALQEFESLHGTPGAPFEYLGKALVYQRVGDDEEEAKCFELALRRFPHHPLLSNLQHQLLFRLHQSSKKQRKATYQFALLASHLLPKDMIGQHTKQLFDRIEKNWEELNYCFPLPNADKEQEHTLHFNTTLAFWTAKPYLLLELLEQWIKHPSHPHLAMNILRHCMELQANDVFSEGIKHCQEIDTLAEFCKHVTEGWESRESPEKKILEIAQKKSPTQIEKNIFFYLLHHAIDRRYFSSILQALSSLHRQGWSSEEQFACRMLEIWAFLYENRWEEAADRFSQYPVEILTQESSIAHFLYGCWLQGTEGHDLALIHFQSVLHVIYPRSWTLLSHYMTDTIREETSWFRNAFFWEKKQLYRQLALFYHCAHDEAKSRWYHHLALG